MWLDVAVCTWLSLVVILIVLELVKEQVVRPVRNSLQFRECVEEVKTPGRSPVAATEL